MPVVSTWDSNPPEKGVAVITYHCAAGNEDFFAREGILSRVLSGAKRNAA